MDNPLLTNLQKWREIGASETVLDWIANGIKLNFVNKPHPFILNNRRASLIEQQFIGTEIQSLLNRGYIVESGESHKPICISPIYCIPKKKGKFRLINDLRRLNSFCKSTTFQYEDIKCVFDIVKPNDKLITVHIKDGFYHIPVSKDSQKYLGFRWNNKTYMWTVLPFGLSASPYFFCKTIRQVIKFLRSSGFRLSVYVDDFILCSEAQDIEHIRGEFLAILSALGLQVNWDKSKLVPATEQQHIGYVISTANEDGHIWIRVPPERIKKVKHDINRALKNKVLTARALARICGQLISMSKAILPAKLLLCNLYRILRARTSWQDKLCLDTLALNDLEWWKSAITAWNGRAVVNATPDAQLITDASGFAWGAVLKSNEIEEAHGIWDSAMSNRPSNCRELMAVLLGLLSFEPRVKNKTIQILPDNITTVAYINYQGGVNSELTQITSAIWRLAFKLNITIAARYLAGVNNQHADRLSRTTSASEWMLNRRLFLHLERMFGPHTIDRFASIRTTQLVEYNSLFLDPTSSGVDALAQTDWAKHNNFVNPPFRLLGRVVQLLKQQKATATLVAPWWQAQPWFRELMNMSIAPPFRLPNHTAAFLPVGRRLPEPLNNRKWKIYVWRVSGRQDSYT